MAIRKRLSPIPSPFQEQLQTHNLSPNQLADLVWNTMSDKNWLRISKPMMHAIGDRETIMLTELINLDRYYRKEGKEYLGWFWATASVLYEHTTQLEDVQRRVLNSLVDRGIIQRKRAGVPARNYFKINYEVIPSLFESNFTGTSSGETPELEIGKHRNLVKENTGTIYKEINKEIINKKYIAPAIERAGQPIVPRELPTPLPKPSTKKVRANAKQYLPLANKLSRIISSSKNIKHTHQQLTAWSNDICSMVEDHDISADRISAALNWYRTHVGGSYVPVIESGRALKDKFLKLEAAITRASSPPPQNGNGTCRPRNALYPTQEEREQYAGIKKQVIYVQ